MCEFPEKFGENTSSEKWGGGAIAPHFKGYDFSETPIKLFYKQRQTGVLETFCCSL